MPNNIAPELPIDNNALMWCEIFEKVPNGTTGTIESVPVTGRTDIVAYIAATELLSDLTPINAALSIPLPQIGSTNRYSSTMLGSLLKTHLLALAEQTVYVHFRMGAGPWHEVAQTIVKNVRAAT